MIKACLLAVVLIVSVPAFAQGCALCYTQAASAGARMIQALKSGILVLIIPPTLMSLGVIGVCYRKRNQFQESDKFVDRGSLHNRQLRYGNAICDEFDRHPIKDR